MRIPERPPRTHTISQRQNGPNYQFHLGLLSADEPPAPQYENNQKVKDTNMMFWREAITGKIMGK